MSCNETCDAEGSVDASLCDKTSGKCLSCKENIINDKCSECTPGNFPFPNCNQGKRYHIYITKTVLISNCYCMIQYSF